MKDKDTILLENAYIRVQNRILNEELSESEKIEMNNLLDKFLHLINGIYQDSGNYGKGIDRGKLAWHLYLGSQVSNDESLSNNFSDDKTKDVLNKQENDSENIYKVLLKNGIDGDELKRYKTLLKKQIDIEEIKERLLKDKEQRDKEEYEKNKISKEKEDNDRRENEEKILNKLYPIREEEDSSGKKYWWIQSAGHLGKFNSKAIAEYKRRKALSERWMRL